MDYIMVLSTTGNIEEAKTIAGKLLDNKLAACVNIIPKVISMYHWNNDVVSDEEVMLIIKTRKEMFDEVKASILKNHSYEVPEIISFDISNGSNDYLDWIFKSTKAL